MTPRTESLRARFLVPALLYTVHLGLVLYACPAAVFFGGEPIMGIDYQTHFEQTRTLTEALERFGRTWAYDPGLLAGQPAGLLFDVDNMAHFLFTYSLTRVGVAGSTAFNLFVLLVHLLAPLSVYASARLLRTGRRAEIVSLALGVLLWHFDSTSRFCWWAGMISFATISVLSPLVIVLFYRLVERDDPDPPGSRPGTLERAKFFLPLALLLALLLLTHAWAFATLVVPLVGLYLRRLRTLRASDHALVLGAAAIALAANLFWLWPALHHLDLISPSSKVGQATPLNFLADYFDLFVNPLTTGAIATRTLFRTIAFAATVLTLLAWRRARDPRFFLGVLSMLWLLGLAYLASLVPLLKETEPYRFILPAIFLGAVLGGPWLSEALSPGWIHELGRPARVVLVVLLVLLVPRLGRVFTTFIPELLPRVGGPPLLKPNVAGPRALSPTPELLSFRHNPIPDDYRQVAAYLRDHARAEGRILVEWWVLAEYLRWSTGRAIVGGFPDRRMVFEAANLFRDPGDARLEGRALADYLVRYNIRYLVVTNPLLWKVEWRRDLLEPVRFIGLHRLYRVRHSGNYFASGSGQVKASLNRLVVEEATPAAEGSLVLRFHHLDTLRCSPDCRLSPAPLPDSAAAFIRVSGSPSLPRRFVIDNKYR